jgi:hypothetical protein
MAPINISVMVFYNGERLTNVTGVEFRSNENKKVLILVQKVILHI